MPDIDHPQSNGGLFLSSASEAKSPKRATSRSGRVAVVSGIRLPGCSARLSSRRSRIERRHQLHQPASCADPSRSRTRFWRSRATGAGMSWLGRASDACRKLSIPGVGQLTAHFMTCADDHDRPTSALISILCSVAEASGCDRAKSLRGSRAGAGSYRRAPESRRPSPKPERQGS